MYVQFYFTFILNNLHMNRSYKSHFHYLYLFNFVSQKFPEIYLDPSFSKYLSFYIYTLLNILVEWDWIQILKGWIARYILLSHGKPEVPISNSTSVPKAKQYFIHNGKSNGCKIQVYKKQTLFLLHSSYVKGDLKLNYMESG